MTYKQTILHHKKHGFSLVEVTVTIAILGLIALVILSFQTNVFSLGTKLQANLSGQQEARGLFKQMTSELRTAAVAQNGAYPIAGATVTSITFYSDPDKDGVQERLRYFLDGKILKKGILEPNGNPATYSAENEQVSSRVRYVENGAVPIFTYFDTTYDGTSQPLESPVDVTKIRLVKIELRIDADPNHAPEPLISTTQITMRNLKDNL